MKDVYCSNFSFIRDGFTPSPLQWFSIEDCLPKIREDDYGSLLGILI